MTVQAVRDFTGRVEGAFRVRVEPQGPGGGSTKAVDQPTFGDLVKDFSRDVNDLQFRAGDAVDLLATGKAADVHQVMIAVEEAGIALDLMLEIRNRVLEGYQELIRMQV